MKRHNVYSKFEDEDGNIYYFSMEALQEIGDPIDENGIDMELVDDEVYILKDGEYTILSL